MLLHVLPQLGDDLLGALPLGDAVPQAALKLLIIKVEMRRALLRSKSIHLLSTSVFDGGEIGDNLRKAGSHKVVFHVVATTLVGWKQFGQHCIHPRLLQQVQHRR